MNKYITTILTIFLPSIFSRIVLRFFGAEIGKSVKFDFRSGTCYEYPVYDLEFRKSLSLVKYPLVIMDVCLFKERNIFEVDNLLNTIKSVTTYFEGNLTLLYHNNYITTKRQKKRCENLLNLLCS